jgi:hypothetical protein
MTDDRMLDALLGELKEATDLGAAPALEGRLRAELDTMRSAPPARRGRPVRRWAGLAAAAAIAAVASAWLLRARVDPAPARAAIVGAPEAAATPSAPAVTTARTPAAPVAAPARATRRTARPAPRRPVDVADAGEFVALAGAPALSDADSLHLVRVSVPATALAAWGAPPAAAHAIEADVIVGHDGLARAIRFVGAEPSRWERD